MPDNRKFEAIAVRVEMHRVTMEELISRGMELRESKDNIAWEMGDLAILVTREFGSTQLATFAKGIGVEVSTLRRYRDISKAYPFQIRNDFRVLPWSAFRQVAAREDRVALLERAANENWSVEKLAIMAKPNQIGVIDDGLPVPPKPEMMFCTGCRHWFIPKEFDDQVCHTEGHCMELNK